MLSDPFEAAAEEATAETPPAPDPAGSDRRGDRFREAVRAMADLRRGGVVVVVDGPNALAYAAAETVGRGSLDDLRDWGHAGSLLIRPIESGHGGAAPSPAGFALPSLPLDPAALRPFAEAPQIALPDATVPPAAAASVALTKLAHLLPTLVGREARPDGVERARAAGAVIVQAGDILALRAASTKLVRVGEAKVPLEGSIDARIVAFRNPDSGAEHIAVLIGTPERDEAACPPPLVRLHSECFTGDVLGSLRCDCGPQLRAAIHRMAEEGAGAVLYLAQEGRGIGLLNKLRSYVLQDRGLDTLDANAALGWGADERDFSLAASMLRDLGLMRVRLLTNNPSKVAALTQAGIEVERASLLIAPNGVNDSYLATKAARFGHLLG